MEVSDGDTAWVGLDLRAWGRPKGTGQGAWLILTLRASDEHSVFRARSASEEDCQASRPLSTCASDRPAWFGHAPGVEQFGEPLFREDFLFFGHLAHGLA